MAGYVKHIIKRLPGETEEEYEMRKRRINLSRTTNYLPIKNRLHHGGGVSNQKPIKTHDCSVLLDCNVLLECK